MGFFTRGGMKHAAKREARAWSGLPVRGLTALLLVAATTGVVVSAVRDAPAQPSPDAARSSQASRGSELAALVARSGARKSPASIIAESMAQVEKDALAAEHATDLAQDEAIVADAPPTAGHSMLFPLVAPVTSPFGYRLHPILGDWRLHTGVDFGAPCGTAVVATKDGKVSSTGPVSGYGLRIVIDNGTLDGKTLQTAFNHLSVIGVRPGQDVKAGDPIARVGNTGLSTGCHLHFEVMVGGAYTDPMPFLDGLPSTAVMTVPTIMTASPSPSPSPSLSPSPSPSPSLSPSPSPSLTPSPTPTPTPSPSKTPTPTPSPSNTPTPTPTATATKSPTPSTSARTSSSPSASGTGSPSPSGTATP